MRRVSKDIIPSITMHEQVASLTVEDPNFAIARRTTPWWHTLDLNPDSPSPVEPNEFNCGT
ncbi:MAG TPA: hypothetical protein VFE27_04085 [Acidobacteriaceae bacterium]|nr:hypothetical protein [Acidobacteriaceae bacterium]